MAKKGKKKKAAKEEEPEEERTEHDNMDLEMLREVVPMLKQQLEKQQMDRNYVQLERDTIQTFSDITTAEIQDVENTVESREKEMERMEENHRVEIRVYLQKVKHLEYEHKNNLKTLVEEGGELLEDEAQAHSSREQRLKTDKKSLNMQLAENDLIRAEEIGKVKKMNERNLQMMRKIFEKNTEELSQRQQKNLDQLRRDLGLRRKVHIHEIEERKNLHINDLMRNHTRAFTQMKRYYNDITNDNLKLIKSLKDQVREMKKRQTANQKLMHDISQENQRLKEPLTRTLNEVAALQAQARDRNKDQLSLRNARARLRTMEEQISALRASHQEVKLRHQAVAEEKEGLFRHFEDSVDKIQQLSEVKNTLLEHSVHDLLHNAENIDAQMQQVAIAGKMNDDQLQELTQMVSSALDARNRMKQDLEFELVQRRKRYNDTIATLKETMQKFGIGEDEIEDIGCGPMKNFGATNAPAELVAA